jgi:hypothetical protein
MLDHNDITIEKLVIKPCEFTEQQGMHVCYGIYLGLYACGVRELTADLIRTLMPKLQKETFKAKHQLLILLTLAGMFNNWEKQGSSLPLETTQQSVENN